MKLFYLFLICSIPLCSNAQVTNVKTKVETSQKHYEVALNEINFAISKLEECENSHSIDLMHNNAIDAKKKLFRAKRFIGYAKDDARATEKEASNKNCFEAEDQAKSVEVYYYDAQTKIASAIDNLSSSIYKRDLDFVKKAISDANTDINRALNKMKHAVNKYGVIKSAFEDCNN